MSASTDAPGLDEAISIALDAFHAAVHANATNLAAMRSVAAAVRTATLDEAERRIRAHIVPEDQAEDQWPVYDGFNSGLLSAVAALRGTT